MSYQSNVNDRILRTINRDIALQTRRFAMARLSGVFRAIFRVEKSYEVTEPQVFTLDQDPDQILLKRLSPIHRSNLALAIQQEQVLAARYQLFTEYDFVVVADVSQSMMYDWWCLYGGKGDQIPESLPTRVIPGDRTKLYLLKYVVASFLHAADFNDFSCVSFLAGGNSITSLSSRQYPHLADHILGKVDSHYTNLVRSRTREIPRLQDALRQVLSRRRRSVVLFVSDFLDTLQLLEKSEPRTPFNELLLLLGEIAVQHRLMVIQINDFHELNPPESPHESKYFVKQSHWHDGESALSNVHRHVKRERMAEHAQRVTRWRMELSSRCRSLGIRRVQVVAGLNDDRIDQIVSLASLDSGD